MQSIKKWLLLAAVAVGLSACVTTQDINNHAVNQFQAFKQKAAAQGAIDNSSTTAKRIHKVFQTMKPYAERENQTGVPFAWEVVVIKDNELNAWAMPGGKMAFYTGLIEKLQLTDDEIATVMGHEMIHALKEHSKSSANRGVLTDIAFGVTQAVVGDISVGGYSGLGILKTFGVDNPFSRADEKEADELGLYLMAKAGYNPKAAPNLWVKMGNATGGSGGFFSTHPSDSSRLENMQKWLPKALEYYQARP